MPQFMSYPLNYNDERKMTSEDRTMPAVAADNDYNTGTTADIVCNIADADGGAQTFTHVFVKGRLTEDIDMTGTGGSFTGVALLHNPPLIDDSGFETAIDPDGFTNLLIPMGTPETATTLTFAPQEATDEIVEVMILNEILSIADNERYTPRWRKIPLGENRRSARKRTRYIPPYGNERDKHQFNYDMTFDYDQLPEYHALERLFDSRQAFTFIREYERYPHMVFPSLVSTTPREGGYLTLWKGAGERLQFSIREI